jgi:uncharacterized protein
VSRPPVLCIFARAPVLARVKTRLAAALGDHAALAAHVTLVESSLDRLAHVEGLVTELWLDDAAHPAARRWSARWGLPLCQQAGSDLGERMNGALEACLARGAAGIVVGTDCPDIDAAYVTQAAAALNDHDLVLGPAEDGGYGLIGARRRVPEEVFAGIAWGTPAVLEQTLEQARAAALTVACLPTIWDVDDAGGWARFTG